MAAYAWVTLTTDYGLADGFVAVCHGVILRRAPDVRILDVSHLVPPQDVRFGAAVLAKAVPHLPPAVNVAVIDPTVGTWRRAVVLRCAEAVLMGPDNGLLQPAADAIGGPVEAYEITNPEHMLRPVSATFHGRDVFAPAAAHLANGGRCADLGAPVDLTTLVRLPGAPARAGQRVLEASVVAMDRFGNLQTGASGGLLEAAGLLAGDAVVLRSGSVSFSAMIGSTFADVGLGELVVLVDSDDRVAVAVNGGDAAARTHLGRDAELIIDGTASGPA